eukprot:TRINITY_DN7022_c0_g1_i1.p1 TRINITY_DN7022_c0_g1~~TRINITY_DN7022_c0_g1_i1.p1  ORF type:complete len:363 (-),score=86.28 TRINITY_DN7022_c0_g1_i1:244-1332(-)
MSDTKPTPVTVLGAGYSGLTTAAELTLRGYRVNIRASSLGYQPPLTIVGTQSRRWPGSATSNSTFDNDDLLDREIDTIQRLVALSSQSHLTGVSVVPALKVSRSEGNTWNRRPIADTARLRAATNMQRSLRMMATPKNVEDASIALFEAEGYKSVDETQVVKIETGKYFRYLIDLVTSDGGNIELGTNFTAEDIKDLQKAGHVVNCLGNAAGSIGGAKGEYYSNPGEVVIWKDCPRDFGFYVMDDDKDAGVMQMPDGSLYLSTAAVAGPDQTKTTIRDCDGVCRALFGAALSMESGGVGLESWKTDRPMRKGGFNIGASKGPHGFVSVDNSGHGGAGVAASWACAARAVDALAGQLPGHAGW